MLSTENQISSFKISILLPFGLCCTKWAHHLPHPSSAPVCGQITCLWALCLFCVQIITGKELMYTDHVAWRESQGRQGPAGQTRPSPDMAKPTKRIAFGADEPRAFRLPWLRFSVIFLICMANSRVYDAKSGYGPNSPPPGAAASPKRLTKVAYLRFANEPVWARNPDSQPTKVIPPILSLVPPRHQSLVRSAMALSLTSNRYRKHIPLLELMCLLQSPAMRSNAGMANRRGRRLALSFIHSFISFP
jgi:hypothetical protein